MIKFLNPQDWAERTFGQARLGDKRRTCRAVSVAASMISKPNASLPEQMRRRKHLVAAYRLLSETDVTHAALLDPHCRQTLSAALRQPLVLLRWYRIRLNLTIPVMSITTLIPLYRASDPSVTVMVGAC